MTYSGGQRGSRRATPAQSLGLGQFLLGLGRGVRAAVDPNFAADEYRRQWERGEIGAPVKPLMPGLPLDDYKTDELAAGLEAEKFRRGAGFPGQQGLVFGLDKTGNVDRTKSDLYKQYAQTPEGQFERYFQTPEMDRYFGVASRGKGAPKDVAGMQALAGELTAPQDVPLSSYYRAQSAMGRASQAQIQEMYKDRPDLQKWAAANPMLAQREYNKKYGTTDITKQAAAGDYFRDLGGGAQSEAGYTLEGFGLPANPVPPTEQPGPAGMTQGQRVDYFRGADNLKLQQAAFTSGGEMPAFQTTGEKTAEFLKRPGISALF
jgi:hypothetical protein